MHAFLFRLSIALLACVALVAEAGTPSFLCTKAKTWLEKTICASDRLSDLDLELASVYARLLRVTTGETQKKLTAEQNRFWAARGDCRGKPDPGACLDTLYSTRIVALRERPDYTEQRPTQIELPPEIPRRLVAWKVDLAAHDHGDELVVRREPL